MRKRQKYKVHFCFFFGEPTEMSAQVTTRLNFDSPKLSVLPEEEKKKGKVSSILPLKYDEKPFYFKISGKLKIFQHDESSFSLAVLPETDDMFLLSKSLMKLFLS